MEDERLDELERQIHDAIRFHREQYERAIQPYLDQLSAIRSLRPQVWVLPVDQFDSLAFMPAATPPES